MKPDIAQLKHLMKIHKIFPRNVDNGFDLIQPKSYGKSKNM